MCRRCICCTKQWAVVRRVSSRTMHSMPSAEVCAIVFAFLRVRVRAGNDHIAAQVIKFAYQPSAIARNKAWKGNGSLTQILSTHFFQVVIWPIDWPPDAFKQPMDTFVYVVQRKVAFHFVNSVAEFICDLAVDWHLLELEYEYSPKCRPSASDISQRKLQLPPPPSRDKI